jgi:hypothetical protein
MWCGHLIKGKDLPLFYNKWSFAGNVQKSFLCKKNEKKEKN